MEISRPVFQLELIVRLQKQLELVFQGDGGALQITVVVVGFSVGLAKRRLRKKHGNRREGVSCERGKSIIQTAMADLSWTTTV